MNIIKHLKKSIMYCTTENYKKKQHLSNLTAIIMSVYKYK